MQRRQEATKSMPPLKLFQNLFIGLCCYRCRKPHISRSRIPNLSSDYFNQLFSAKGKIAPTVPLPLLRENAHCLCFFLQSDDLG